MTELTERQREVLHLALGGQSNQQIAATLGVSVHTVNDTLRAAYQRLGVTGRTSAALTLVTPPQPPGGCLVFANRESALAALGGKR